MKKVFLICFYVFFVFISIPNQTLALSNYSFSNQSCSINDSAFRDPNTTSYSISGSVVILDCNFNIENFSSIRADHNVISIFEVEGKNDKDFDSRKIYEAHNLVKNQNAVLVKNLYGFKSDMNYSIKISFADGENSTTLVPVVTIKLSTSKNDIIARLIDILQGNLGGNSNDDNSGSSGGRSFSGLFGLFAGSVKSDGSTSGDGYSKSTGTSGTGFGGRITSMIACTCSTGYQLTISGDALSSGTYLYNPGASKLYANYSVTPGASILGTYNAGGACLITASPCVDLPITKGTISALGTSS